jgi:hypothetical protein
MTSSGPNSPGTIVDDDTIGTYSWTDVNNAKESNDSYAKTDMLEGGP